MAEFSDEFLHSWRRVLIDVEDEVESTLLKLVKIAAAVGVLIGLGLLCLKVYRERNRPVRMIRARAWAPTPRRPYDW